MTALIQEITIESDFGLSAPNIHCPICGQLVATVEELNLCEHCLAAFYDGGLLETSTHGVQIFEKEARPDLFKDGVIEPGKMLSTGSNFILSSLTGGMACGPVWGTLQLVFEMYLDKLEKKEEKKGKKTRKTK